jgi:multidrug efflux pump subunit AcrB
MEHRSDQELLKSTHNTARYFVEHPHVSWIALAALFLWGIYGYTHMPQKKDPDISVRVATAVCNWPGSTAEQQEQLVTRPLEDAIAGNKTIHPPTAADYGIRSVSYPGATVIWVQLQEGLKDTREQFSDINLRLQQASAKLPQGAGPIQFQSDFGDTAALMLTMASPQADASEVAVRSRDIQASIVQTRQHSRTGNPRIALVFAFPYKLSAPVLRDAVERFRAAADQDDVLHDTQIVAGNGFLGIDGATSLSDDRLKKYLDDFVANRIPASSIDPDVWEPILVRDTTNVFATLNAVAGPKYTYAQLDDFSNLLARSFQNLSQTSRVDRAGVLPQQVNLDYSQERLASYGLKPSDLSRLLSTRNITASGGAVEAGPVNATVTPSGIFPNANSIGNTIVGQTQTHAPVYLRDLVQISRSYQSPPPVLNSYSVVDEQGKLHHYRAVTISVFMRDGEQIQVFGKAIDEKLAAARTWLPSDIILARTSDQPLQVKQNIDLFMDALYEAIALVVIIAFVGFQDWRSTLLMALSIPITLALTFGIVYVLGIDLQLVSIATLIIALGLLVDDPVVANDAIKREIAAGMHPKDAAWIGPTRLATAIMYATVTNIIAYLPFLMLTGNTGQYLYSLPVVMTAALVASRLVSMTFIPLIAGDLLKPSKKTEKTLEEKRNSGFYGWYHKRVGWAIQHRWKVLAASCVFLAIGVVFALNLKTQFFPDDVQYWSYVDLYLPNGTSIAQTRDAAQHAENIVNQVLAGYEKTHSKFKPDAKQGEGPHLFQSLTTFAGSGGPRFWFSVTPEPQQTNYAQLILRVNNKDATPGIVGPLQAALDRDLPGVQAIVHQLQTNPVEYPVEIRISSTADVSTANEEADNHNLQRIADSVDEILRKTPGVDVSRIDWQNEAPNLNLQIDPDKANLAGITNADVANASLIATSGTTVTTLREGDKQIPVVARLELQERGTLADFSNTYVSSSNGAQKVPIGAISIIRPEMTVQAIRRQEHFRTVGVHAYPVHGVLASEVLKRIKPDIDRMQHALPPGYALIVGGEEAKQVEGFSNLAVILAISAAGIYLALLVQFKNAVKPLIVFAAVPYGVCGAMIGLYVTHTPFGFMAFLGIASLVGVIVSHIIVLFDFIEERREAGESLELALRDAGIERLRPVLITVGATVTALFPLAIHGGPLWQPLCYAQIGGLAVATFITLLLEPVLYSVAVLDLKVISWDNKQPDSSADGAEPTTAGTSAVPSVS